MLGLGTIFGSIIGAASNAANTRQVNKTNLAIAQMTNANNRQLVDMQNKAAKAESELAYKRSSAPNQVRLMQQAGMSRAGAINALNGGGSYTPAPVNTSQDQGATMQTADLSALSNIGQALESLAQRKHEKQMQAKQIAAQKELQEQQLASSERIARLNSDTSVYGTDKGLEGTKYSVDMQKKVADMKHLEFMAELQLKNNDLQFRKDQYEYGKKLIDAQVELTNAQKEKLKAELEEWKSRPARDAREAKYQVEKVAALYNVKVTEAEMNKYLKEHFVYNKETDTYVPIINPKTSDSGSVAGIQYASKLAEEMWGFLFTIIPIKPLLESIKLFGK